jgi:Fic family protein
VSEKIRRTEGGAHANDSDERYINRNKKKKKKAFALSYKAKERTIFIVFLNQQVDKVVREVVTEGTKCVFHLGSINAS